MPDQTDRRETLPRGRPLMPDSYGIDKGAAGMLPWSSVEERLASARNYWVASVRPDGLPHAAPVWGIWLEGAFYFATDRLSRKGRNLTRKPGIAVHLESGDDVVMLEGSAEAVTDRDVLEHFADTYDAKYQFRPDPDSTGNVVYALRPRVIFAWIEKDFPRTATRWAFDS